MNTNDITVSEQVFHAIRSDILKKELAPGEKLTIKKLHEKYGVSSSPIREAMFRLQQEGLIEYRSNAGMRVAEFTKDDLAEIYMLLTEFDVIAMKAAMSPANRVGTVATLERSIQRSEAALDTEDWSHFSDEFHNIFYQEARNGRLMDASHKIRTQSSIFSNSYESDPKNRREILEQHKKICEALKAGDLAKAEQLMREHLSSSYVKALETL